MIPSMKTRFLHAPALASILWGSTLASFALDPIGTWLTDEGKATVRMTDCGGALCATIVSLKEPNDSTSGKPKTDVNNVDARQAQSTDHRNANPHGTPAAGRQQVVGRIYNPEDGKTYDANVVLENGNVLKVQGCVLFICQTRTWTRKG